MTDPAERIVKWRVWPVSESPDFPGVVEASDHEEAARMWSEDAVCDAEWAEDLTGRVTEVLVERADGTRRRLVYVTVDWSPDVYCEVVD